MTPASRTAFWQTLEDCLVELHRLERADAHRMVQEVRGRLADSPDSAENEMIYHAEPFEVAGNLIGHQLSREKYKQQYNRIYERNFDQTARTTVQMSRQQRVAQRLDMPAAGGRSGE